MSTTPVLCAETLAPISLDPTGTRPPIVTEALQWLEHHIRQGPVLSAPAAVHDYLRLRIAHHDHEVFTVLFLDAQNRLIEASELFRGTLTQTSVYPLMWPMVQTLHSGWMFTFPPVHRQPPWSSWCMAGRGWWATRRLPRW